MSGCVDRRSARDKRKSFDGSGELTGRTDQRTKDEAEYLAEFPQVGDVANGSERPMADSR
jgi:hypothetical protein